MAAGSLGWRCSGSTWAFAPRLVESRVRSQISPRFAPRIGPAAWRRPSRLSAVATLVNPYGWRLHAHIYRYLGDRYLMNRIDEFKSPDFHGWSQRAFAVILLLIVIAFAGRRFSGERFSGERLSGKRRKVRLSHCWSCCWRCMRDFIRRAIFRFLRCCWCWSRGRSCGRTSRHWRISRAPGNGCATARPEFLTFSDRMGAQEMELRGHLWPVVSVALAFAICLEGGWLGSRQADSCAL
jgi:hypothetical protein